MTSADRIETRLRLVEDHWALGEDEEALRCLEQAMEEGYSTAPDWVREMGWGAGMGLPNMKKNSDKFKIDSVVGEGTTVEMIINFP